MRLAVCHPGADTSTSDVYDGLVAALVRAGHEVVEYLLNLRIGRAKSWYEFNYRRAKKIDPTIVRPTFADWLYLAGERFLPICLREHVDWAIVVTGQYFHSDWLWMLQRANVPTALLCTETPYDQEKEANALRYVTCGWTNERSSVEYLRQYNPHVWYLPHAYDPEKHHPGQEDDEDVPAHDVVFVGTGFSERIELLMGVDWTGIDLGLYGNWELPRSHPLRRFVRGGVVPNKYAAALYRRA